MASQTSWNSRSGDGRFDNLVLVPQKLWVPKFTSEDADTLAPFVPIPFLWIHPHTHGITTGVPLLHVAAEGEHANLSNLIVDAGEKVLKDAYRAYLRILWPGYEHVEFVTSIPLKTVTGRINRGQLAQFVVKTMQQYFISLQREKCLPAQKVWAVAPAGTWRVEDLVLVAFHLVHGNTFQVELKVNRKQ